ncbi:MAG: hypothetical protein Q4C75_07480, partial [Bergeyella zoohelcum]|nr:hypothetical protein [Bergeyella zoohelcum]
MEGMKIRDREKHIAELEALTKKDDEKETKIDEKNVSLPETPAETNPSTENKSAEEKGIKVYLRTLGQQLRDFFNEKEDHY